jgi:hypothetical protein
MRPKSPLMLVGLDVDTKLALLDAYAYVKLAFQVKEDP